MSTIVLMCLSHPAMKLGPGAEPEIQFRGGFARVDTDQYPEWERWVRHPSTPEDIVNLGSDDVVEPGVTSWTCDRCEGIFADKLELIRHRRTCVKKADVPSPEGGE